ncbi:MAG: NAD(P)-dependent oxidoreductase [Hyphomicrobiaceae bacterium]
MALLVTGAMGHVGLEVVRQAALRGHEVIALRRETFDADSIQSVGDRVVWVQADLADEAAVDALVTDHKIDGAIHPAAVPNDNVARKDPLAAVRSNVMAAAVLLDAARRHRFRRVINVSTGSVFQDASDHSQPVLESRRPAVTNIYSTTKACGEMLVDMYARELAVSAATVRISWVYGPPLVPVVRDHPRGPIPWFLRCALSGVAIDDGSGRDFQASYTHVSDVAAGLLAAYEADRLNHTVYHLGSGRNYTTADVMRAVEAAVPGARLRVGPGTAPYTDHTGMRGPLSGDRLFEDTGFRPRLDLDAGIAAFADWMRNNRARWQGTRGTA